MPVGDITRVTVNQDLQSSIVQNVLYYKTEIEDSSGDDITTIAERFKALVLEPFWQNVVSNEVTFECNAVQKVFPLPIGAVRDFNTTLSGLNVGESLPAMNAALIQKSNPDLGGVGKKGRVYIAGILENDSQLGRVSNALFQKLEILATQLQGNLSGGSGAGEYDPVWVTRDNTAPFAINGFVKDLVFLALPRVATQRRRRTPIRATS